MNTSNNARFIAINDEAISLVTALNFNGDVLGLSQGRADAYSMEGLSGAVASEEPMLSSQQFVNTPPLSLTPTNLSPKDLQQQEQRERNMDRILFGGRAPKAMSAAVPSPPVLPQLSLSTIPTNPAPDTTLGNGSLNIPSGTTPDPPISQAPTNQPPPSTLAGADSHSSPNNQTPLKKRSLPSEAQAPLRPLNIFQNDRILLTSPKSLLRFQSVTPASSAHNAPFFMNPLLFYHLFIRTIQKYMSGTLGCVLFFNEVDALSDNVPSSTSGEWNHIHQEFNQLMHRFAQQINSQLHTGLTYHWIEISIRQIKAIYLELITKFGSEEEILRIIIDLRIEQMEYLHEKLEKALVDYDNEQQSSNEPAETNLNIANVLSILQNKSNESVSFDDLLNAASPAPEEGQNILNFSTDNIDRLWKREQEKHVDTILHHRRLLLFGENDDIPHIKSRIATSGLVNPLTYEIPRELWQFDRTEIVEYVNKVKEQHPQWFEAKSIPSSPTHMAVNDTTAMTVTKHLNKKEIQQQEYVSKNRRIREYTKNLDSSIRWSSTPPIAIPPRPIVKVRRKRTTPKHSGQVEENGTDDGVTIPPEEESPVKVATPTQSVENIAPIEQHVEATPQPMEDVSEPVEVQEEEPAEIPTAAPSEEAIPETAVKEEDKASRKRKRVSIPKTSSKRSSKHKRKTKQQRLESIPGGTDRFHSADTVQKVLAVVLEHVKQHDVAFLFMEPVDIDDYEQLVKHRVDLTQLEEQVTEGKITTVVQLWHQLVLMFQNAQVFTPPDSGGVWEDTERIRWDTRPLIREALEKESALKGVPVPRVFRLNVRPQARFEVVDEK